MGRRRNGGLRQAMSSPSKRTRAGAVTTLTNFRELQSAKGLSHFRLAKVLTPTLPGAGRELRVQAQLKVVQLNLDPEAWGRIGFGYAASDMPDALTPEN